YATQVDTASPLQVDVAHAKNLLSNANAYLIDTREPYEHGANDLPSLFDISKLRVINIPLSRMANALSDGQLSKSQCYILLCRSGNRS
ncbi:rhodanese-like domain-containing protein, partial [Streptomyces galilaeus]|uniref:rhodanese-like domain-containing protein n=1 Tax=Streptomyces galilaeus TaxID=33899 RepID=UPI0038F6E73F